MVECHLLRGLNREMETERYFNVAGSKDICTVVTGAAGGIGRAVAEKLPAARWITGQSLVCDGGHSLG